MNVNVLFVAVHHVVAFPNVKSPAVVIVISLPARDDVLSHAVSVHVSVIVPDSHAFTYFLLGSHHVQLGADVSLHTAVTVVA